MLSEIRAAVSWAGSCGASRKQRQQSALEPLSTSLTRRWRTVTVPVRIVSRLGLPYPFLDAYALPLSYFRT